MVNQGGSASDALDNIIKALAFEKVTNHLNAALGTETRPREKRRIRIALKHLSRFLEEARKEVDDARAQTG